MNGTKSYEIEIKSLLGSKEKFEALKATIAQVYPKAQLIDVNSQLNHYFVGGDLKKLLELVENDIGPHEIDTLRHIIEKKKNPSVRTRQLDIETILVAKASINDTTSANGTARIEFEAKTPRLSLSELDAKVLDAGYDYQAKWSRDRQEYNLGTVTLCIDRNAGYGYVAELEKVITDPLKKDQTIQELRNIMASLAIEELPQDRLERMFKYYNKNWQNYYGTDKIFNVT